MSLAKALRTKSITRIEGAGKIFAADDTLAIEEPLEIRVNGKSVAVVMRTPGNDRELAAGFLVTEGIARRRDEVLDMVRCEATEAETDLGPRPSSAASEKAAGDGRGPKSAGLRSAHPRSAGARPSSENVLDVLLAPGADIDFARLTRHVFTSSSCGICSKASIEAVHAQFARIEAARAVRPPRAVLAALPKKLRAAQAAFAATGGLHASALFSAAGELEVVREDVGRHNALDKVIGHAFFAETLPLEGRILLVSGRVSFELMQKALAAGIPCVAAISAPTSAAVEFAEASGQALVGFLRGERMNVYAGTIAE